MACGYAQETAPTLGQCVNRWFNEAETTAFAVGFAQATPTRWLSVAETTD